MSVRFTDFSHCDKRRSQSGAAIIVAILTLAIVAVLAAAVMRDYSGAVASVSGRHDQAQARLLAVAAVDWARNVLSQDAKTSAIDYSGEVWAIRVPATPVEDGEVGGEIVDMSGNFDLNRLVTAEGVVDANQLAAYQRLLVLLGVSASQADNLANSLLGWIGKRSDASAANGGSSASNGFLTDTDELKQINGYNVEIMGRIRPFVVALPVRAPLNVNTASAEVLASMIVGLSIDSARILVSKRKLIPFKDMGDFVSRLPDKRFMADPAALSVSSRYFLVSGRARYGQSIVRMQVLLDRKENWPNIVWRKII